MSTSPVTSVSSTATTSAVAEPQIPTVPFRPPPLQLPDSISPKGSEDRYEVLGPLGEGNSIILEVLTPTKKLHHLAMKLSIVKPGKEYPCLKREADMLKWLQGIRHMLEYLDEFATSRLYVKEGNKLVAKEDEIQSYAILTEVLPEDTYAMYIQPFQGHPTPLSASKILDIGKQVFETLFDFHLRGIVYLDIKPENITYDPEGKLTVFDVGCARRLDEIDFDRFIGTLSYRAPEQMVFNIYDASVDVWALGMTLFELYTGYPLIDAEGAAEENQTIIDCLHRLVKTVGKLPPPFIRSVPREFKPFFNRDGSIAREASSDARKDLEYFDKIERYFPGFDVWKGCIFSAGHKKKDDLPKMRQLVKLLSKMICYENRITPKDALDQFFKEPTEGKR